MFNFPLGILAWLIEFIWAVVWTFIYLFLGMVVTAIALLFGLTKKIEGTKHPFAQFDGDWELEILPDWKILRPFQNLRDGLQGDKRGWYQTKKGTSLWHKWWWNAVRNPLNTQKRFYTAIDISRCKTWVAPGYLEWVDDDNRQWGEKRVMAKDLETKEVYESYESIKPLIIFGKETGYVIRRVSGYKFDLGEEKIPFPDGETEFTYEFYRDQCFQYARDGYHNGDAQINLDRLAPKTGRQKWMFTLKKIDNT